MAWTAACVILAFLQIYVLTCTGLNCGYPGSPAFGRPHPLKDTYRPGEFVSYTCTLGYSLQGHISRQCQENGTWSGVLPVCDTSISSVNHVASSRATLSLYTPDKAIDGDRTSCTYTDKKKPRWIRVDLKEPYLIQAVAVTVPKNIYATSSAQFTIYIISVRDRSIASYHKCAYLNGKFFTETVKLTCSGGSIYGQYIHIEDNRNDVDYFSICEIDVFVKRDSYECGQAERPIQSFNLNPEAGLVQYRCVYGYRLEGPSARRCLPNGQWSNEQPVCREISCPSLSNIEHGSIHYTGVVHGRLTLGTSANFSCDYGYQLAGVTSLACTATGEWSEGFASCQPIDCEVPPVRNTNERYIIMNGTTTYGSMVLLYCGDSPDEGSQSVVRTCREDGMWSPVDMECTPQNMLAKLGLVDEVESALPTGLIVGMVIVVLLLLASFLLIFLIKRKGLLRGESNHSLPSKGTSSSCVGSTNGKPTLYDNDTFYASIAVENINGKHSDTAETKETRAQNDANPGPNKKGILSAILSAKRKGFRNNSQETDRNEESSAATNGVCVYEEIGQRPNLRDKKKFKGRGQTLNITPGVPPIYAQVDLEEKRKSRLVKSLCDKFDCDTLPADGQYHSVEAPTFDELDSEPVKLRELPPIPTDDDESSVTYASLSRPPEPPESDIIPMRDNEIYCGGIYSSAQDCDSNGVIKDNELYSVR